jgi:hypothetical protein
MTGRKANDRAHRETIMKSKLELCWLLMLALFIAPTWAQGQGSTMSYRGRLTAAGAPANGPHDIEFKLFATTNVAVGAQQGATQSLPAVPVTNGVFVVSLDFGAAVFDGSPRFLEIGVRPAGSASAIHSLSAGTATNLANGAGVQSLNNLKDNVTLAAGPNISITPSGKTLTIGSAGGGGSGPWSLNGADTYYTAGNVGIGTSTPTPGIRLEVSGATLLKPGNGNIQFGSPNAELGLSILPNAGNRADLRFDGSVLKLLAGTGAVPPTSTNGLAITSDGNVGIGNGAPTLGYRLDVSGATRLSTGNGTVQFGTPNAELGLSITPNAGNRADLRFDGSVLKLLAATGVVPPSADSGLAITTAGNVGIGTTTPVSKLEIAAQDGLSITGFQPFLTLRDGSFIKVPARIQNAGGSLHFTSGSLLGGLAASPGLTLSGGNVGIGTTVPGAKLQVEGHAKQTGNSGGFIKAMAFIDPFLPADRYVVRCYNSQEPIATASAPCGIAVTRSDVGFYTIDFGFNVENRLISLTPQAYANVVNGNGSVAVGTITGVSGNQVSVAFFRIAGGPVNDDCRFHIVVY